MRYIKSCGFVVFKREKNENYYLIIKSLNGDIGFPKGHVEPGESEIETALRELLEETGVRVETIVEFRQQIEYPLPNVRDAIKQSVYFLGKSVSSDIVCQKSEVAEACFMPYESALNSLTFVETKRILMAAEHFISNKFPRQ